MPAGFLPPAIIEIKAIADKAIAELKEVNKELDKMEGTSGKASAGIDRMQQASKLATGALFAMGTAFAGFAAIGIKEALEAETVMTKLGTTMSAVGLNTTENRKAVEDLASSYIDLGFADDAAAAGLEVLLRTTGDLEKSQKLLALSADVARTKNIGLTEAAGILAKASMGNAKAFKEMGIELDTTLPKSEAIAKAMDQLNNKIGDQAENATKTFAVQMQIVRERFNDTAESLGTFLLPLIKNLLDTINNGVKFVKEHATAFKLLGGIFLTVTVALAAYNAAIKVQMALTKAWTVITTVQKTATALLTGQQIALNTAMKLNPIGLVVSAATLLIGAMALLWNKSEAFRKGVIAVGKAGLAAFAAIIPIIGQVGETILKFVLTPMKTLLSALSHLPGVGKYAKAGLDILNKGLNGVSDFADKASAKAKSLAANLDKLNKPIKIGGGSGGIPDLGNTGTGLTGKGGQTPEQIKAAKEKADAIKKENEEAMKVVASLNEKVIDAKNKFTEKMADIEKTYNEKISALRAEAARKIDKLEKDTAEKRLKVQKDIQEKITAAQNKFNDTMASLNKKKADDLAKLALDNQNKIANITKAGQEKLESIVKQSADRLRNAFAQGTSFSIGDIFKGLAESGKQSAEGLLETLKNRLAGAKKLAENASMLASQGFSQTFIEQVVAQGPEIGNQLAESLKNATPETVKELQATYLDMERTTSNGLDVLANAMSTGATLATDELREAFKQSQEDTAKALQEQQKLYLDAQAEIMNNFNSAMGEAEKERDEAIATLQKDLIEALAEIQKDYQESLAEINRDLTDSLSEAYKDFTEAQDEARKALAEALAEIEKEFNEKLTNIQKYVEATIAAINALKAAMASVGSIGGGSNPTTPTITPKTNKPDIIPIPVYNPYQNKDRDYDAHLRAKTSVIVNAPVTNYDTTSPQDIGDTIVRISKFGLTVI
jgi:hypothetical protein